MKLNIADRVVVQSILPLEGDIITLKIVRDLRAELGFSEKEIKVCNIRQVDSQVRWDKDIEKEIEIGPKAMSLIVTEFEKLNSEKKLTLDRLPAYEKFVTA